MDRSKAWRYPKNNADVVRARAPALKCLVVPKVDAICDTRARARDACTETLIHARTRLARPAVVDRLPITRTCTHTLRPAVVACIVYKITLTCVRVGTIAVVAARCGFHDLPTPCAVFDSESPHDYKSVLSVRGQYSLIVWTTLAGVESAPPPLPPR